MKRPRPQQPSWGYELSLCPPSIVHAGVDEAGRGPLAGPVVAAAVILPANTKIPGLNDSKKITPQRREKLREKILSLPDILHSIGISEAPEIDSINIFQATRLAMIRAIQGLPQAPQFVLVDGRPWKDFPYIHRGVIKGDSCCPSIAAASVLAKCTRDDIMQQIHRKDPRYDFHKHKGYGTAVHLAALIRHGPSPHHRLSFAPVAQAALPRHH